MKTHEETKAAVLKECERFTENGGEFRLGSYSIEKRQGKVWFVTTMLMGEVIYPINDVSLDREFCEFLYRLLNLEARELEEKNNHLLQELAESKIYRFKALEEPAMKLMEDFAKFLNEAVAADCPMITNWVIGIKGEGEESEMNVLNIWAATSHDSPITRCKELRRDIDALKERAQGLVDALEESKLALEHARETCQRPKRRYFSTALIKLGDALNKWKGGGE
jgi:hypothetical protein